MFSKTFKAFVLIAFLSEILLCGRQATAATPDDYCTQHNNAMAGGTCIKCEDSQCLVIVGNLGDRICKKCNEIQCTQIPNCDKDCPTCPSS